LKTGRLQGSIQRRRKLDLASLAPCLAPPWVGSPCGRLQEDQLRHRRAPEGHFETVGQLCAGSLQLGTGSVFETDPIAGSGLDAADSDDSGGLNITDAIYSLNFLFLGGAEPLPPFTGCGSDPKLDALDCISPVFAGGVLVLILRVIDCIPRICPEDR
jgi:hypothetical protein